MLSLLDAVSKGRSYELPKGKESALTFLSGEASAAATADARAVAQRIIARESEHNCGIGSGVCCPHLRIQEPGELVCVAGWSPKGLDYGTCNGVPVRLVVLYLIPEAKNAAYLKEIAAVSRALKAMGDRPISTEADRDRFLKILWEQSEPGRVPTPVLNSRWKKPVAR